MTYVITPGCCGDAACVEVCPVQCIRPRPGDPDFETAEQLYIDPATCVDCQACEEVCPIDAIHSDTDMPAHFGDLLEINAAYFRERPITASGPPAPRSTRLPNGRSSLRVAVVGSGPAACYAAAALTRTTGVAVTVVERLPTPFGLVRAGVAPDHELTKRVTSYFDQVLGQGSVSCYFNVTAGVDVSLEELLGHHHAVIWAGGADSDRRLGVPGETLPGSHAAREFVAWYNGHPCNIDDKYQLDSNRVVIVGNGNVALDVARVLTSPASALAQTDMADHAITALRASAVAEVVVVGRRGAENAAFTTGELEALERIPNVDLLVDPAELPDGLDETSRRGSVLLAAARRTPTPNRRRIRLRFGLTPASIDGDLAVGSVTFIRADGAIERLPTKLVLRAIGHRGLPIPDLPFDENRGHLRNVSGRVVTADSQTVPGLYCAGWIKRGATGGIGVNKVDASETVAALVDDFINGRLREPSLDLDHFDALVRCRCPDVVDHAGWRRIDAFERHRGAVSQRDRAKFVHVDDMLAAARRTDRMS